MNVVDFFKFIGTKKPQYNKLPGSITRGYDQPADFDSIIDLDEFTINGWFYNPDKNEEIDGWFFNNTDKSKDGILFLCKFDDNEIVDSIVEVDLTSKMAGRFLTSVYRVDGDELIKLIKKIDDHPYYPDLEKEPDEYTGLKLSEAHINRHNGKPEQLLSGLHRELSKMSEEDFNQIDAMNIGLDEPFREILNDGDIHELVTAIEHIYEEGGSPYQIDEAYFYLEHCFNSIAENMKEYHNMGWMGFGNNNSNITNLDVNWLKITIHFDGKDEYPYDNSGFIIVTQEQMYRGSVGYDNGLKPDMMDYYHIKYPLVIE